MSKTEKVSAANLKNLAYNILKNFNDDAVKNKTFPELANCTECDKKIFAQPNKAFTTLLCGHVYHRICIEKKLLLSKQLTCPTPKCGKSVEILEEFTTAETGLRRDSESSTSSLVGKMGKQLNIQSQEIIDEEMSDVDNGENKDNQPRDKSIVMVEGSQKRPIEVDTEETNTMQDKSPIKKAKKEVKNEDFQMLKRLIKELITNSPHVSEITKEAVSESSEDLLYLYNNITNSELRKEIA
ncbi:336_t:CDS:1, partial [Diversispora eburnea]